MHNHAHEEYVCPICFGVNGIENDETLLKQTDLVYKDNYVSAFINSFFINGNEGHIMLVTNEHFENIYDIPKDYLHATIDLTQKIAKTMKEAYKCDGITIRQDNEPAGDQHALHYHLHIYPRYNGDNYNQNSDKKWLTSPSERLKYAEKLKSAFYTNTAL